MLFSVSNHTDWYGGIFAQHLMENVSTTRALQSSQARTLKTLSDCITSHGKILEILWEEYADRRRKQYPQVGIEPYEADWPGKKEADVANKGMTTRSQSKKKLGSTGVADLNHPLKVVFPSCIYPYCANLPFTWGLW
ncbi:hypothetical protein S83_023145 [Arachis hypogaea]